MNKEFIIQVAGCRIGLAFEETYQDHFLTQYALFLSHEEPDISIKVEVSGDVLTVKDSEARLLYGGTRISIVDDYLRGSLDLQTNTGTVRINPLYFLHSLGTFLRNTCTIVTVLQDEGLALHGVAILKDEEAYIFIGRSGAGKTTVAQLSEGKVILSDDLVIIKKERAAFCVFPTPGWGDMQRGVSQNKPYPIKGIFSLIQDNKVYLEQFSPARALANIFTVPHVEWGLIPKDVLLMRFSELLSQVPYRGLHFLPEPSFWECIEKERERNGSARKISLQV